MKIKANRSLDFYFLFFSIISMGSLAFFRLQILGFFIPLQFMIFFSYIYFKWPFLSQKKSFKIKDLFLIFLLLTLIFWGINSLIFATEYEYNFRNLFQLIIFVLFAIIVTQGVKDFDISSMNALFNLLRVILTLLAFWALYGYFTGNNINAQFSHSIHGEIGIGSRNVDTYVIMPGFLISFLFLFNNKTLPVSLLSVSIITIAVFFSFSRGCLLTLFLFSFYIIYISIIKNNKRIKTFYNFKYIIIFLLVLILPFLFFYDSTEAYLRLLKRFEDIESSPRAELYLESFAIMIENPINGIGLQNYRKYSEVTSKGQYGNPHNAYTTFGAETGFLGFFSMIVIVFYPLIKYIKIGRRVRIKGISLSKDHLLLFHIGKVLSIYLIIVNLFFPFYVDTGYVFWFYYSLTLIGYYSLKSSVQSNYWQLDLKKTSIKAKPLYLSPSFLIF